jgi:hypothetical protein
VTTEAHGLTLGRVPIDEEPDTVLLGRDGVFFGRVVGRPCTPAEPLARMIADSVASIESAAHRLGLDPAVLAERLAKGGIAELVEAAIHYKMSDGDPLDEPSQTLDAALKLFAKE